MKTITQCLASNIKKLRKDKELTQVELAQRAGISPVFLQGIEGEKKWISPATVRSIAIALEVSELDLFQDCFTKSTRNEHNLPPDIFEALSTTCQHPTWQWEAVRWIIEGFQRQSVSRCK